VLRWQGLLWNILFRSYEYFQDNALNGGKRGYELPPELDTKEKIRKKIEEIEQSQDKKLKRAAKTIIEAHATGDDNQKKNIE
jgi:hypothetical protein